MPKVYLSEGEIDLTIAALEGRKRETLRVARENRWGKAETAASLVGEVDLIAKLHEVRRHG